MPFQEPIFQVLTATHSEIPAEAPGGSFGTSDLKVPNVDFSLARDQAALMLRVAELLETAAYWRLKFDQMRRAYVDLQQQVFSDDSRDVIELREVVRDLQARLSTSAEIIVKSVGVDSFCQTEITDKRVASLASSQNDSVKFVGAYRTRRNTAGPVSSGKVLRKSPSKLFRSTSIIAEEIQDNMPRIARRATMAGRSRQTMRDELDVMNKMSGALDKVVAIEQELQRGKSALNDAEGKSEMLSESLKLADDSSRQTEQYLHELSGSLKNLKRKNQNLQVTLDQFVRIPDQWHAQLSRERMAFAESLKLIKHGLKKHIGPSSNSKRPYTPPISPAKFQTSTNKRHGSSAAMVRNFCSSLLEDIRGQKATLRKVEQQATKKDHFGDSLNTVRDVQHTLKLAIERHRESMQVHQELADEEHEWDEQDEEESEDDKRFHEVRFE